MGIGFGGSSLSGGPLCKAAVLDWGPGEARLI